MCVADKELGCSVCVEVRAMMNIVPYILAYRSHQRISRTPILRLRK